MSKTYEIPLNEVELLRIQLFNERLVSAREAVTSSTLLQQTRQAELVSAVASLMETYKSQVGEMEFQGIDVQKGTMVVGPKVEKISTPEGK